MITTVNLNPLSLIIEKITWNDQNIIKPHMYKLNVNISNVY